MAKNTWKVPITVPLKGGGKVRLSVSGATRKKAIANGKRFTKKYMKNIIIILNNKLKI